MNMADQSKFKEIFSQSINQPDIFWGKAAEDIHWNKKWDKVLDDGKKPFYRWFAGGELNTCYNALDYQVESGRGEQAAIIYDSPVTNNVQKISYKELLDKVSKFAGVLSSLGVKKGDTVIIYMPMIPEAVVAMLSCARIGAVHSVVFGGFAPNELAIRIDDAKPKIMISASCGIEGKKTIPYKPLLDEAIKLASHKPEKSVIYQRPQVQAELIASRDLDWNALMKDAKPVPCVSVAATDPLYILYTSGTTGPSKGAILSHYYYYNTAWSAIYYMRNSEEDVIYSCLPLFHANASMSNCYTALLCKASFAMGKRFSLTTFWDEIASYKVTHTHVMGSILVLLMKQQPKPDDAQNTLKTVNSVPLIPESLEFEKRFGVKLIGMFGATETSICIASPFEETTKPNSCGKSLPQYDCRIFDDTDRECPPGVKGEIVVRGKLPFIQMEGYHNMPEATLNSFRNLWYHTGDWGIKDENGYFYFADRKKDAIRRRGENISSYEVEEVVNSHPAVLESAAIAIKDEVMTEDEVKICVVLKEGLKLSAEELIRYCKDRMAYFMVPRYVEFMKEFPKTPNQKIQKFILRDQGVTAGTWDREKSDIKVGR